MVGRKCEKKPECEHPSDHVFVSQQDTLWTVFRHVGAHCVGGAPKQRLLCRTFVLLLFQHIMQRKCCYEHFPMPSPTFLMRAAKLPGKWRGNSWHEKLILDLGGEVKCASHF